MADARTDKEAEKEVDFMDELANYKPTGLLREIVKQKEDILATKQADYDKAKKELEIQEGKKKPEDRNRGDRARINRLGKVAQEALEKLTKANGELEKAKEELSKRLDKEEEKKEKEEADDEDDLDFMKKYFVYKTKYINLKKKFGVVN